MRKTFLLFLLPFCSLILTSCSNGFEMLDQGDHGILGTGFYNQTPVEKEDIVNFIKEAKEKLNSDEFNKYTKYGSDVYSETTTKEKDEASITTTTASLVKDGHELTSEIVNKENETKKHIIYIDATEESKVNVYLDKYVKNGNKEEVKSYVSSENKKDDSFEFLNDYYQEAKFTYLDNMKFMLDNFSLMYDIACTYLDTFKDLYISCYKCDTSIKQNDIDELYKTYSFIVSNNTNLIVTELYYSEDFTIKKLTINLNDLGGITSQVYMSLLPYDEAVKPLNEDNRESVLPNNLSDLIYDFSN